MRALGQSAIFIWKLVHFSITKFFKANSVTGPKTLNCFDCVLRRSTRLNKNQSMLLILNAPRTCGRIFQRGLGTFPSYKISLDSVFNGSCWSAFNSQTMPGNLAVHITLLDRVFVHL